MKGSNVNNLSKRNKFALIRDEIFFFFLKQKTAYEIVDCDWSSDVCSSDLNQGFHEVYGTTPFGYLRDCRLLHARRLLMTSGLSISQVATAVGYTCRSKFATAFRQQMGLNPKAFQMQAWRLVS